MTAAYIPADDWIATHDQLEAEKYHALGVVTYQWNFCEEATYRLLERLSGSTRERGRAVFGRLVAQETWRRVSTLLNMQFRSSNALLYVKKTSEWFEITRLNRNLLSHFTAFIELDEGPVQVRLGSRDKISHDLKPFSDSLEDLRRVADDCIMLCDMLRTLESVVASGIENLLDSSTLPISPIRLNR